MENPQQQLKLLRCLFGKLQQPDIVETLITLPETQLKEYFTKYVLEHAIAIPHCEAIHAKSSAIYLLRPTNKVHFQQADDDNDVEVSLVIALIVENPQQQLKLLRCLFSKLQQPDIVETLITLPETQLKEYFTKYVLDSDE
ncbi:PTS galactitol transporter subunit IIA [Shigella sonnei]|uniref:PTS galactitol transporter subunit IIA n=1 Tax=Shigella sonnei TaxID=624 RepID=UPI0020967427|nr:PTS galactitol transporter subunit IIA [Shigella sonnei]